MAPCLIVNIDVPDLGAGIAFYRNGLGFELRRRLFRNAAAEMAGPAGRIFLLEQPANTIAVPGSKIGRTYAAHWTPVHLDIAIDDLDAAVTKALAAGATTSAPPSSQVFGRMAPLRDPFGHGFCLIEFNADGYEASGAA